MISDLDIFRSAQAMLKRYGKEGAGFAAAERADAMLAKGDLDGQRVWLRILNAIDELQRTARRPGEAEN